MASETVAAPAFDPSPALTGQLSAPRAVAISDATPTAVIHYTTDGTTPTTSSTVYTGPSISVDASCTTSGGPSETVEALAAVSGYTPSSVTSATYTCAAQAATPTFNPVAGSLSTPTSITISSTTLSNTIYYTTDGTTPTNPVTGTTTLYSAAVLVSQPETLRAIAFSATTSTSAVGSAAYTYKAATPVFTPTPGTYTTIQTVSISDSSSGVTIYYTTNNTAPTSNSTVYSGPGVVSASVTIRAIAEGTGFTNSTVATGAYTINLPTASTPAFSPSPGTYSTTQTVTISDGTAGATIYYTTDGSTPTTASVLNGTAPINITVSSTTTLNALAVAYNYLNSTVASAVYTLQATTPVFSPVAGTYSTTQTVTISDSTAGNTIYYTTDGSTPTTGSATYSAAITVSSTETLKAIAAAGTLANSTVGSAVYTLQANTPTFSPIAGTYATAQTVSISDTTASSQSTTPPTEVRRRLTRRLTPPESPFQRMRH